MGPPAEEGAIEVHCANPPWTARERVVIAKMEILGEMCEIQKESSELEHFFAWTRKCKCQHHVFSQKSRGMQKTVASSCCSTHLEAKEQVEVLK